MSFTIEIERFPLKGGESLQLYELVGFDKAGSIARYEAYAVFFAYVNPQDPKNDRSREVVEAFSTRKVLLRSSTQDGNICAFVERVEEVYRIYQNRETPFTPGKPVTPYTSRITLRLTLRPLYGLLSRHAYTRVFRGMTTEDILKRLLIELETNLEPLAPGTQPVVDPKTGLSVRTPYLDPANANISILRGAAPVKGEPDLLKTPIHFAYQAGEDNYTFIRRLLDKAGYHILTEAEIISGSSGSSTFIERLMLVSSDVNVKTQGLTGLPKVPRSVKTDPATGYHVTKCFPHKRQTDVGRVGLTTYYSELGDKGMALGEIGALEKVNPTGMRTAHLTDFHLDGYQFGTLNETGLVDLKSADGKTTKAPTLDFIKGILKKRAHIEAARYNHLGKNFKLWTTEESQLFPLMSHMEVEVGEKNPKAESFFVVERVLQYLNGALDRAQGAVSLLGENPADKHLLTLLDSGDLNPYLNFTALYTLAPADRDYFPPERPTPPEKIQACMGFVFSPDEMKDPKWEEQVQPKEGMMYPVILMAPTHYEWNKAPFDPHSLSFEETPPSGGSGGAPVVHYQSVDARIPRNMRQGKHHVIMQSGAHASGLETPLHNGSLVVVHFMQGDITLPYISHQVDHNIYDQTPSQLSRALADYLDTNRFS